MRLAGVDPRDPTSQHLLARVDQADAVALVLQFPRNREDSPAAFLHNKNGSGALRRSPCLADIPQHLIQSLHQLVGALPVVRTPVVLPAL